MTDLNCQSTTNTRYPYLFQEYPLLNSRINEVTIGENLYYCERLTLMSVLGIDLLKSLR